MSQEEIIVSQFCQEFPLLGENIRIARPRRIFVLVNYGDFARLFDFAVKQAELNSLCAITGLDEGENLAVMYHLAHKNGVVVSIKTVVPKNEPVLKSTINYFPSAEVYERELVDLFGFRVEGLPPGSRYPLTDDWPNEEHPLRKDWHPKTETPHA